MLQALLATFTDSTTLLPGAVSVLAGLAMIFADRRGKLPQGVSAAWGSAAGWAATLLFMVQPLAQLVRAPIELAEVLKFQQHLRCMMGCVVTIVLSPMFAWSVWWMTPAD